MDLGERGDLIRLSGPTAHHLLRVTGVAPGESVELFDGQGGCVRAVLTGVEDGCAILKVSDAVPMVETAQKIWLMQAQLRATTQDTVLRMATELGITRFVPVSSERTVAKGDKKDRWARIVSAAAGQSGRATLPDIDAVMTFEAALLAPPSGMLRWICVPGAENTPSPDGDVAVLVGPEGGWSAEEVQAALSAGWLAVSLGGTVLRADTAVAAAITLAQQRS